jgi:hypothetical protein
VGKEKPFINTLSMIYLLYFFFFYLFSSAFALKDISGSNEENSTGNKERIVKTSLQNQAVYVLDRGKVIFVAPCTVGKSGHPTPKGVFYISAKSIKKRSHSYGFWVKGNDIRATENPSKPPPGGPWEYVGYPMPYWVEFAPGYGFHEGFVWTTPRTHGCIRLHGKTAIEFFNLVSIGTKILIADSFPEDLTVGKHLKRPRDELLPDPPAQFMISEEAFEKPWEF